MAATGKPTDLGAYLIQETAARGMTMTKFAEVTGLSKAAVSRLIFEDAVFTADRCRVVADALGVPFETVALLGNLLDANSIEPPTE